MADAHTLALAKGAFESSDSNEAGALSTNRRGCPHRPIPPFLLANVWLSIRNQISAAKVTWKYSRPAACRMIGYGMRRLIYWTIHAPTSSNFRQVRLRDSEVRTRKQSDA